MLDIAAVLLLKPEIPEKKPILTASEMREFIYRQPCVKPGIVCPKGKWIILGAPKPTY